ncbi:hypothetical protein [Algisphaera agarilytica]|uniref:DUF2007 domain-containing protein n=1 Tax=Algisphaera agarilytica TaxID=1385975 RepID=A0A7X0LMG5_9BACT|nr:hypothetical protein [Algisphaera agarilytica]MBB6431611.1 hypothetical protein [Algisphaera agarilytica]
MGGSALVLVAVVVTGGLLLALLVLLVLALLTKIRGGESDAAFQPDAEWKVLRTYNTAEQAHLDRAMLEGCGVPVRLANEHTVGTDWMYGIAVGVDLRVPEDQLQSAELMLRDARVGSASVDLEVEEFPEDESGRRCSRCGSTEVYRVRAGIGWAISTVVLLGIPLLRKKQLRCDACGNIGPIASMS